MMSTPENMPKYSDNHAAHMRKQKSQSYASARTRTMPPDNIT